MQADVLSLTDIFMHLLPYLLYRSTIIAIGIEDNNNMNRVVIGGHSLKPQDDIEKQGRSGDQKRRKSRTVRNPIKVVMDMMG
jgi:hypothetical protein